MEKKEIKISLWTFYVLAAGIVILIGAIIIGVINAHNMKEMNKDGIIIENVDDRISIYNEYASDIVEELYGYINSELLEYSRKSLHLDKKITLSDIDDEIKIKTVLSNLDEKQANKCSNERTRCKRNREKSKRNIRKRCNSKTSKLFRCGI